MGSVSAPSARRTAPLAGKDHSALALAILACFFVAVGGVISQRVDSTLAAMRVLH